MKREVTVVVFNDALGPVFGSLYVKPAMIYRELGLESRVIAFARSGEYTRAHLRLKWNNRIREFENALDGNLARWPLPPSRAAFSFLDTLSIASWLLKEGYRTKTAIMQCGGAHAAYHVIKAAKLIEAKNLTVVLQSWGPLAKEYAYGVSGSVEGVLTPIQQKIFRGLNQLENFAYTKSDAVIVLSEPMLAHARHLLMSGPSSLANKPVLKIPCCVDTRSFSAKPESRERIRNELNFQGKTVYGFVGSLHPWQKVDLLLDIFSQVHQLQPNSRLLLLSNDSSKAAKLCEENGIPENARVVKSVPFSEVPAYLSACDFGLMGRGLFEPASEVNTFSSPIKIPEYLAVGCPVILGDHVGDFSSQIKTLDLGIVAAANDNSNSFARKIVEESPRLMDPNVRECCINIARKHYDLIPSIARYIELFETL